MNLRRRGILAELPSEVAALTAVAFMVALGFGVVAPAIAPFAERFGVSRTAAAAVISAFALARLVTAPLAGRLVDAIGERLMLGLGIGIVAVSSALAGLSQSYWQLLVLRGLGGIGSIMFSVSSISLLYRVTPSHMRGRAQGAYAGGFLLGSIAGPAVGVIASWSLRAPFFLYAATLAVAGALGLYSLRHSELAVAGRPVRHAPGGFAEACRERRYLVALSATFAESWAVVGVRSALIPLFVIGPMKLGNAWNYAAFFVVSIVSGVLLGPVGRYADRRNRMPLLAVGLSAGAIALVLLPSLASPIGLVLSALLLGVAGAVLSVVPGAIVGDIVGDSGGTVGAPHDPAGAASSGAGRGGSVVSAYQMASDAGSVAGPVVAGWLADHAGFGWAFGVAAAVVLSPMALVARRRGVTV